MAKKLISTILCTFLFLTIIVQTTFGANNVSNINVDVVIFEDGSAYIIQTWNCYFTEGTEGYFPIQNLGEMSISDFLVSDINGPYTFVENWDIDANFEEKVGQYGLVETDVGYELCWGISEYGEKHYVIEYKINNFVGAYNDFDGFNFQFINSGMGTLPTDVTVKIVTQDGIKLDSNNAGTWAFGFDGKINFADGQVIANTENPLSSSSDSVIIMLQLNKGLINPTRVVDESFETVKAMAFEDSDYDYGDEDIYSSENSVEDFGIISMIIGIIMALSPLVFIGFIVYFLFSKIKLKKKLRTLYKNADYFREVPIAGNLEATFVLGRKCGQIRNDGNLIGSAFLKLINSGCLEPISEKKIGFFGKEKENISLQLIHPPQFIGVTTKMLYDLLILASSTDQTLQESELEAYCTRNHTAIKKIIDAAKRDGKNTLEQIDCYDKSNKRKFYGLSERGEKLLLNIIGFKKYLLDFSLINERSIDESIIWQDYLTFATLLGIADKVIEQFENVYPNPTEYSENAHYYYLLSNTYNNASYGAAKSAQSVRSGGSGGRSSFGGGGGFSGGGTGGGTR